MSDLATTASLIVATLDLKVVKLLRAAIRSADLQGQAGRHSAVSPAATAEPRHHRRPDLICEPRRHICPPVYASRRVCHAAPRIVSESAPRRACDPRDKPCGPESADKSSPIQPPWKTLPWQEPPRVAMKVKVVEYRTDIINKGSLIDYFI